MEIIRVGYTYACVGDDKQSTLPSSKYNLFIILFDFLLVCFLYECGM